MAYENVYEGNWENKYNTTMDPLSAAEKEKEDKKKTGRIEKARLVLAELYLRGFRDGERAMISKMRDIDLIGEGMACFLLDVIKGAAQLEEHLNEEKALKAVNESIKILEYQ